MLTQIYTASLNLELQYQQEFNTNPVSSDFQKRSQDSHRS